MNDEKWSEIKDKIIEKFGNFEEESETEFLEDDLGNKIPQTIETLIFDSALGKVKLVRTSHPKILEQRPHYHKGSGGARIEYIVSDEEKTYKFEVFKYQDNEWVKLDMPTERLNF